MLDPIRREAAEAAYKRLGALGSQALDAGGIGNINSVINTSGSGALSFGIPQKAIGGGIKRILEFATGEE